MGMTSPCQSAEQAGLGVVRLERAAADGFANGEFISNLEHLRFPHFDAILPSIIYPPSL